MKINNKTINLIKELQKEHKKWYKKTIKTNNDELFCKWLKLVLEELELDECDLHE